MIWSLDENQCITLKLRRVQGEDCADSDFEQRFDAPLTHTDQGQLARCRLLEAEEQVRCGNVPDHQLGRTFEQMARDAARIGHRDRALHYISCAVQRDGPTFNLLNLRAIYLEELGDLARAESVYRQAAEWPTAAFNLALFLHRNKRHQEALDVVDQVMERSPQPAYLVLKGDIVAALGQQATARLLHQDAISRVVDPTKQSVWSLGWLARCASSLGHDDLAPEVPRGQHRADRSRGGQRPAGCAITGARRWRQRDEGRGMSKVSWDILQCPLAKRCRARWEKLEPVQGDTAIRFCAACERSVYLCQTDEDLEQAQRARALRGAGNPHRRCHACRSAVPGSRSVRRDAVGQRRRRAVTRKPAFTESSLASPGRAATAQRPVPKAGPCR
ncbi:MAG: tetratricopeptide repeat protein [Rhodanobacteraceae bacterium]|nr:tetratricopeptide repeat protein [Rhodanobacteraceae bacterium]